MTVNNGDYRKDSSVFTDNVDTTELLHEHEDERCKGGASVAGNTEHLEDVNATALDLLVLHEKYMGIVQVTGGLDLVVTETAEGIVCVTVTALANEPTGLNR